MAILVTPLRVSLTIPGHLKCILTMMFNMFHKFCGNRVNFLVIQKRGGDDLHPSTVNFSSGLLYIVLRRSRVIDNRCKLYCTERKTEIKVLPEVLYTTY